MAVVTSVISMAALSPPFSDLANSEFFLTQANDLAQFSVSLLVATRLPSVRKVKNPLLLFL